MTSIKQNIKILFSLLIPAMAVGLSGCFVDEKLEPCPSGNNNILPGSEVYITFKFPNVTSSRAGDYVDGSHDYEHAISDAGNYALFFGTDRILTAKTQLTKAELTHGEYDKEDNLEAYYRAKFPVNKEIEIPETPELLGYCLVLLNGNPVIDQIKEGSSIESVLSSVLWTEASDPKKIGRYDGYDGDFFTMTNSAYIVDGAVQVATPFTTAVIHEKEEDIKWDDKDKEKKIITVYVERMVAKVNFEIIAERESGEIFYSNVEERDDSYFFTPIESNRLDLNHQINLCTDWTKTEEEYTYEYIDETNQRRSRTIKTEFWDPVTQPRNWRAHITGWDMNALERQSFAFKKINKDGYSFFTDWNKSTDYRSYWAEDPDYDFIKYPWQFRKAVDIPNDNSGTTEIPDYGTEYSEQVNNNVLMNYSWKTLNNPYFRKVLYIPEHTYNHNILGVTSLDNRRDLLAGSHLIVTGYLEISGGKQTTDNGVFEAIDIFRDESGVYYSTTRDCLWSIVRNFNNALISQERMRFRQYDWDSQSTGTRLYAVPIEGQGNGGIYQLYYKEEALTHDRILDPATANYLSDDEVNALLVAATIKDGDGRRVLMSEDLTIQNSAGRHLPIYSEYKLGADSETHQRYDNSAYLLGTTANRKLNQNAATSDDKQAFNDVTSLIYEWAGPVDHYNDGKMYYASPLKLHVEANDIENKNGKNVYGSVRNTWYTYQITDLKGIGIPVDDPDQPIVPNWDEISDGINLRIKIIPWHNVDLGGFDIGDINKK